MISRRFFCYIFMMYGLGTFSLYGMKFKKTMDAHALHKHYQIVRTIVKTKQGHIDALTKQLVTWKMRKKKAKQAWKIARKRESISSPILPEPPRRNSF